MKQSPKLKPEISVVLPTHNELTNLKVLIPQIIKVLKDKKFEIIVVDDISTDGSPAWLTQKAKTDKNLKPLFGKTLNGIGNALKRGYDSSKGNIIVSLDADLSINPSIIPKLISKINSGSDLVIGSRHSLGGKYEAPNLEIKKKRLVSQASNWILRTAIPVGVSDFSINCRAIKKKLWSKIQLKEKTNIWLIEMIVESAVQQASITQIPIKFKNRRFGTSKLQLGREVLLTGHHVLRLIFKFLSFKYQKK